MRLLVSNMHDELDKITCMIKHLSKAGVAELVDAPDSGSGGCKAVRVRVPASAITIFARS